MVGLFLYLFGLMIALGGAGLAASGDFKRFQIPNIASLLVMGGFAVSSLGAFISDPLFVPAMHGVVSHLISMVIVFVVTFVFYAVHGIGAGDAKFATAVSIWFALPGVTVFIFYMSLLGGVVGVLTLALARIKPFKNAAEGSWIAASQAGGRRVPYGIAIALGFVLALAALGYFDITTTIKTAEIGG